MRKVVVAAFLSLDGVMQAPGGPEEDRTGGFDLGGWSTPYFDEQVGAMMEELFASPFDLLLGRRTYDIFAGHWPVAALADSPADEGTREMARMFNRVTKYVATHAPGGLDWENTEWLGPDAAARIAELKQGEGPDLLVQGSAQFIQTLLAADLVDRFRLVIVPVTLGKGKRLFGEGAAPGGLRLAKQSRSPSGALLVDYDRAGEVATGTFALSSDGG